jgi:hypothetical protein
MIMAAFTELAENGRDQLRSAVAADRFDRAFFERRQARSFFVCIDRLMEHEAAVLRIVPPEAAWCRLPT